MVKIFHSSLKLNNYRKSQLRQSITYLAFLMLIVIWGCSEYQQVLNSKDNEKKFQKAKEYYNNDEFQKALTLFDDIRTYYRGTERGQKIAYYFAYCQYGVGAFRVAAFRFKSYYESYSRSDKAEDALYMHAFCLYKQSPRIELYQKPTKEAISAFKLFLDKYPNSDRVPECNKYMDKLEAKLRRKAFEKAKLWYKILDYKAAITSLKNLLDKYPSIENREKVEFLIVDSYWQVAEKSVISKKEERYKKTFQKAKDFLETYPASKHKEAVEKIRNQAQENLSRYNT
jgi:outer membrane protein assembly factor BamD